MRTETRTASLPVPRESVYDFLVDYRHDPSWRAEISDVRLVEGVVGGSGALYEGRIQWQGLSMSHRARLIDCDRPAHMMIASETPELSIYVTYRLSDTPDGCLLEAEYAMDTSGPMALLEPFAWSMLMGWVRDDLPELASHVAP